MNLTAKGRANQKKYLEREMDKRIERAYYKSCSGVAIDIMDIGKVFAFGRDALERNPTVTDDVFAATIRAYVERLAK